MHLAKLGCKYCGIAVGIGAHGVRRYHDNCKREAESARMKAKTHTRRLTKQAHSDLTPTRAAEIKHLATICAHCEATLTDTPGPRHKHLDHIVPLGVGGSHTEANVRVLCRTCNLSRPQDGSDLAEQRALLELMGLSLEHLRSAWNQRSSRCQSSRPIGPYRSVSQIQAECVALRRIGRRARVDIKARQAAEMRANGAGWRDISEALNLSVGTLWIYVSRVAPALIGPHKGPGRYTKCSGPRGPQKQPRRQAPSKIPIDADAR